MTAFFCPIPVDRHGRRLRLGGGGGERDLVLRRSGGGGRRGAVGSDQLLGGVADAGKEIVLVQPTVLSELAVEVQRIEVVPVGSETIEKES